MASISSRPQWVNNPNSEVAVTIEHVKMLTLYKEIYIYIYHPTSLWNHPTSVFVLRRSWWKSMLISIKAIRQFSVGVLISPIAWKAMCHIFADRIQLCVFLSLCKLQSESQVTIMLVHSHMSRRIFTTCHLQSLTPRSWDMWNCRAATWAPIEDNNTKRILRPSSYNG